MINKASSTSQTRLSKLHFPMASCTIHLTLLAWVGMSTVACDSSPKKASAVVQAARARAAEATAPAPQQAVAPAAPMKKEGAQPVTQPEPAAETTDTPPAGGAGSEEQKEEQKEEQPEAKPPSDPKSTKPTQPKSAEPKPKKTKSTGTKATASKNPTANKPKPAKEPKPKKTTVDLTLGKKVFMAKCRKCHGANGKAQTTMGKKHEIPDMSQSAWHSKWPTGKIKKIVTNGKSGTKMRAFASKLSPEEINAVAAFAAKL